MKRSFLFLLLVFGFVVSGICNNTPKSSSEILLSLKKLNNFSRVLYIAAHPDDENTRLIAYLSKGELVETAYLSLTRGDGGQNLIGTEKGEYMGILRTQELMEARKVDGGTQYFTRAVDFGYSKKAEETLEIWNRDEVLSDMVWVIRKFRPDVIVTRFPSTGYGGHGHHTASAILAEEAFDKAGDEKAFSDQLKHTETWSPRALYFNSSSWWDKELPKKVTENPADYIEVDIGTYSTLLGKWHNEIAAESRSKHKSQGFGVTLSRGSDKEYLKYVKGERLSEKGFNNLGAAWKDLEGGGAVANRLQLIISRFDPENPQKSVPGLCDIYRMMESFRDHRVKAKQAELKQIIADCAGLFLESNAQSPYGIPGDTAKLEYTALTPYNLNIVLKSVATNGRVTVKNKALPQNQPVVQPVPVSLGQLPVSQPHWLLDDFESMYTVSDQQLRGLPESPAPLTTQFTLEVSGTELTYTVPVEHKWRDRVEGEKRVLYRVHPEVTITPDANLMIFSNNGSKEISVNVKSHLPGETVEIVPKQVKGWSIRPVSVKATFDDFGGEKVFTFQVSPEITSGVDNVVFQVKAGGKTFTRGIKTIDYDHIEKQVVFPGANVQMIKIDLENNVEKVGYLMGAGDDVPQCLQYVGIQVDILDPAQLSSTDLSQYKTIVGGIRLFNTQEEMAFAKGELLEYVESGGVWVQQYNTSYGMVTEDFGPYPFEISRDRVTREQAEPTLLAENHRVFKQPNKINQQDFESWVQERGLYFAGEWDDRYTPLISWNDPGEDPKKGSLLVANYGKGAFVYTGISFFRQLPKGVPGAYRLFVNLLNYRPDEGP